MRKEEEVMKSAPESEMRELALACAAAADATKGQDIVILNIRSVFDIADYFVIASGSNPRQLRAMADEVQAAAAARGAAKVGMEGYTEGKWVLVDYGSVVVHLFLRETRAYYDLEALWGDAVREAYAPPSRG
jgi:ribosome-associated protein